VLPFLAEGLRTGHKSLAVLCLYDLDGMGAEVLMQALRTHPAVIVDGMIHENPYYTEPGRFLARIG